MPACVHMALRVVSAMQAPIKKGERYLFSTGIHWLENDNGEYSGFHPRELRLPDRFQPEQNEECAKPKNYPLGDFDAEHWAEEFCRTTGFKDEAWAHSWFASAIMTGFDEANKRYALGSWDNPAPEPEKCANEGYHAQHGEKYCPSCHDCTKNYCNHPKPDPVEAKIARIKRDDYKLGDLEKELRELVELARGTK